MKGSKHGDEADRDVLGESSLKEEKQQKQPEKLGKLKTSLRQKFAGGKVMPSKKWEFLETLQSIKDEGFMPIL